MLILPGRSAKGQRPSGPVLLNRDSPQAQALVRLYPLATDTRDYVLGRETTWGGGVLARGGSPLLGAGLLFPGTLNGYFETDFSFDGVSSGTVSWWQQSRDTYNSGTDRGIWGQCAGDDNTPEFTFRVYTDNVWYCGWSSPLGDRRVILAASASNWANDRPFLYTCTWGPSGSVLYCNGVQIGSNASVPLTDITGAGYAFSSNVRIGTKGLSTHANAFNGLIADWRYYSRELTPAGVWALYDPATRWDLYWQPSTRAYAWYLPVAGGSFNPAWAAGSNVILGATPC